MTIFSSILPGFQSAQSEVELIGEINSSKIPQSNQDRAIYLYSHSWSGGKKHIGTTNLDPSNRFTYKYTIPSSVKSHNISLEIFERNRPFASHGLHGYNELKPLGKAFIKLDNQPQQLMTLTDEQIEKLTHVDMPTGKNTPSGSYFARLLRAGGTELMKSAWVKMSSNMTAEKVQRIYDSIGDKYPRSEPTIPNLLNDLLNNICAIDYEKDGAKIIWRANWDDYQFDQEQSLPNVSVLARKEEDSIIIEEIHIQFRGEENQIIIPEKTSLEELKWAIYMARSSFTLKGESEIHLAEGHLLPGIIAHSFLAFISKENPLYNVIVPYLENLEFINWLGGQGIIFGKGSVIEASALTDHSVAELIIQYMKKKADFINYQPTEPLSNDHHRAIVGKMHYNMLLDHFTTFVSDHWDEIALYKKEIFNWSENMNQKLTAIPKIMPDADCFSKEVEGKRLALCLASLVNQTTFLHWASHSRQQLLTHLDLVSLCPLNKGKGPDGLPAKYGNTPVDVADLQLKIGRTLLNFKAHRFVDYAEPELLKRVNLMRDQYLTFPLKEMFVSTEI